MGYIRHHAIIVTSFNDAAIEKARTKAEEVGFENISSISRTTINGYCTFFIPPDGSKEGWIESDQGDVRRNAFIEWLDEQRYDDGSSNLAWAEVQYGDELGVAKVCRHTNSVERTAMAQA